MLRNLYIPVENKKRELQAKVLLACVAAEGGFKPIIGENREIKHKVRTWPPGIIIWKGLARKGGNTYKNFHVLGHRVVSWCEEGLVYPGADFYKRYRVFSEALNEVDLFFAWGQNQVDDILSEVPGGRDKVIISGNPRLDLLHKEFQGVFDKEVDNIRREFGSFVLINTNFSAYTHELGSEYAMDCLKKAGRIASEEDEDFYRGRAENRKKLFFAFKDMLTNLSSELSQKLILLRPHPSENLKLWEDAVSGLDNVQVVRRGSAIPWIIASELLIHNDCTTGLEAYLLDKPVIAFRPTAGNPYESLLPISVSQSTETINSLISDVHQILNHDGSRRESERGAKKKILQQYIGTFENEYSAVVITRELKNITDRILPSSSASLGVLMEHYGHKILRLKRLAIDYYNRRKRSASESTFFNPKFDGLSVDEVREAVYGLSLHSGRFKNIRAVSVSSTVSCVRIENVK